MSDKNPYYSIPKALGEHCEEIKLLPPNSILMETMQLIEKLRQDMLETIYGRRQMKTPESYEKDEICKYLVSQAAWFFRPFMSGYGKAGVPDIVCCINGKFVSIEVKREGKEPTALQEARMKEIREAGGFACWGTAERVIPILKKLPYE